MMNDDDERREDGRGGGDGSGRRLGGGDRSEVGDSRGVPHLVARVAGHVQRLLGSATTREQHVGRQSERATNGLDNQREQCVFVVGQQEWTALLSALLRGWAVEQETCTNKPMAACLLQQHMLMQHGAVRQPAAPGPQGRRGICPWPARRRTASRSAPRLAGLQGT